MWRRIFPIDLILASYIYIYIYIFYYAAKSKKIPKPSSVAASKKIEKRGSRF